MWLFCFSMVHGSCAPTFCLFCCLYKDLHSLGWRLHHMHQLDLIPSQPRSWVKNFRTPWLYILIGTSHSAYLSSLRLEQKGSSIFSFLTTINCPPPSEMFLYPFKILLKTVSLIIAMSSLECETIAISKIFVIGSLLMNLNNSLSPIQNLPPPRSPSVAISTCWRSSKSAALTNLFIWCFNKSSSNLYQ